MNFIHSLPEAANTSTEGRVFDLNPNNVHAYGRSLIQVILKWMHFLQSTGIILFIILNQLSKLKIRNLVIFCMISLHKLGYAHLSQYESFYQYLSASISGYAYSLCCKTLNRDRTIFLLIQYNLLFKFTLCG